MNTTLIMIRKCTLHGLTAKFIQQNAYLLRPFHENFDLRDLYMKSTLLWYSQT